MLIKYVVNFWMKSAHKLFILKICLSALLAVLCTSHAWSDELPFAISGNTSQLVLGLAETWDSDRAEINLFEKIDGAWMPIKSFPARLGKKGLAWGRGLHPIPPDAENLKKEGDGKTPAGVFKIGGAFGYDENIERHPKTPYLKVTPFDMWVEDPLSAHYNRHLRIAPKEHLSSWEKKQQMKQNDPAHALKLLILHNSPPDVAPHRGSAIFFHIWREDGTKPTTGCTVMDEKHLRKMISWIDPDKNPLYAILPGDVYLQFKEKWNLP